MKAFVIIAALIAGGLASADAAGWRINTTTSMPRGLWSLATEDRTASKGDIVAICPPNGPMTAIARRRGYIGAGRCSNGLEPLLKPVVAVAGDQVTVSAAGITVNGRDLPQSAPLSLDSAGRPIDAYASGTYRVPAGMAWIVSSYNPNSFDSRYFGPVPVANIEGMATPVMVFR
jgi:conjugative transfer signal peptidase TraF